MLRSALVLLSVLLVVATAQPQHRGAPQTGGVSGGVGGSGEMVSVDCLGCICEATTGCNLQFNCTRGLCGPLLISERYWEDAGRCTLEGDNPNWFGAYYRCVTHPWCAAYVVRNYMARFAQDCDGDGRVDCDDFARIHYLGGYHCSQHIGRTSYMRAFRECRCSTSLLNG